MARQATDNIVQRMCFTW